MIKKIISWLSIFIELQLIISLTSLPVLIYWGLPISYMSPIANLIFAPLLASFLYLSSILTIFTILKIPTGWISICLDKISSIWFYNLSFAGPEWLIGFKFKMIWPTAIIAIFIIIFFSIFNPKKKLSISILIGLTLLILGLNYQTNRKNICKKLPSGNSYIIKINGKNYLFDYGGLCRKQNFYSWIDYTILPELNQIAGITKIDYLILTKKSTKLRKITLQFIKQLKVKKIFATAECFKEINYDEIKKITEIVEIKLKIKKRARSTSSLKKYN